MTARDMGRKFDKICLLHPTSLLRTIVEVPLTVSGTPLEEAPPASPATPIEQNKLAFKWASVTLEVYPDTPQKLLRETLHTLREVFPCS